MNVKKYLRRPWLILHWLKDKKLHGKYGRDLSDEKFLKKAFKLNNKKKLDLENPKTFNEKMQWLKLFEQ